MVVDTTVDAFLASYRGAFEQRDVAAIAAHFGDVVHVVAQSHRARGAPPTAAPSPI